MNDPLRPPRAPNDRTNGSLVTGARVFIEKLPGVPAGDTYVVLRCPNQSTIYFGVGTARAVAEEIAAACEAIEPTPYREERPPTRAQHTDGSTGH